MIKSIEFNEHVAEYEEWFEKYPFVFKSEVEAIRDFLPVGDAMYGLEVGAGTGRFSKELGLKEGIEPSKKMRLVAIERGLELMPGDAEHLPFKDLHYDFVLMIFCISYFNNLGASFAEAKRVLKNGGSLIVGFIDKESIIGKAYERRKPFSVFYKQANFYTPEKVIEELKKKGFRNLQFSQTLFHDLDQIKELEPAKPGYGEGSFVLIKAIK
ncbi:class I SAM-dependent methyltransferase [Daejeonella sp.]|jgi:ubiquinone/menaquinone biosynthesis C-methylase UbiE|uniref:class I SAM-dependent methyltransferase n=1 Tax=Daejeonella sp. TaxID=2805397 RepID=UPI003784B6AC